MKQALAALGLIVAVPAHGEVGASGNDSFALSNTTVIGAKPDAVWRALLQLPKWWDGSHTYSGSAANLSLSAKAGGCFCEVDPKDGSQIEHGRVVYVRPAQALRLSAALGPLQSQAVVGTLTWTLKPVEGGTELKQTYLVAGHAEGGLSALASPVNSVMTLQFDRLAAFAAKAR